MNFDSPKLELKAQIQPMLRAEGLQAVNQGTSIMLVPLNWGSLL